LDQDYFRKNQLITHLKSEHTPQYSDFDELFALNSAGETEVIPIDKILNRSTQVTMGCD